MGRRGILALICLTVAAVAATAQPLTAQPTPPGVPLGVPPSTRPAEPASHPATAPTSQPADLSTPRAALRTLAAALHEGDVWRLQQVIATTAPSEQRVIVGMADLAAALNRLHAAAAKAFGEPAAAKLTGDLDDQYAQSLARIDAAEVKVEGDRAAIRYPGAAQDEYELKRADGRWRIPAAHFVHGADAATLDRQLAEMALQSGIVRELTAEVEAGRYKNADSAGEAWRAKAMHAIGAKAPTTARSPQ
jgi:hypothetical protein